MVTQPRPPFLIAGGLLEVHQIPVWVDNLVWLIVSVETGEAAVVDGPQAAEVLAYVEAKGFELTTLLTTHTHPDHIGIHRELAAAGWEGKLRVVASANAAEPVPMCTETVEEGSQFDLFGASVTVWRTEGHQNGHVSYVLDGAVFCGDTLFAGGCGYLFDGPAELMFDSLMRLAQLPADTWVCCAHEYTQDNLRFAFMLEPELPALKARIATVWAQRAAGACTVPSTIGEERATNPFLRPGSAAIGAQVAARMPQLPRDSFAKMFAAVRALKDSGLHKEIPDTEVI